MSRSIRLGVVLIFVSIAGCSGSDTPALDPQARAAKLVPADPKLAETYRQSCRPCHASGLNAAPLAGNRRDWNLRLEKGVTRMRQSVIKGTPNMPAGGGCPQCTPQELTALIQFLAGRGAGVVEP